MPEFRGSGRFLFWGFVVESLLQFEYRLCVVLGAAEYAAPDLGFGADLVERRELQHLGVFDVTDTVVCELLQQYFEHGSCLLAVFGKNITFPGIVDPLSAGKRLLVKGDVCYQIKYVELFAVRDGQL